MKSRNMLWAVLLVCACGVLLMTRLPTAAVVPSEDVPDEQEPEPGYGLFSWDVSVMAEEEAEALNDCIRRTQVTQIYQEIPETELANEETAAFVRRMRTQSIDVYALLGAAEWGYEQDGGSLVYEMEQIAAYNRAQPPEARVVGVMVDVEPYLLDEWDEGGRARRRLMEHYLSGIQAGYAFAAEHELAFWVCIPTFFDVTNGEMLEELIANACDGIAVMNYDRTDEYMQMAKEVGYAREYQKGILCIYELQEPGKHELEEINTYAEVGLEALWASAERLEKQFAYDRLQFAYHYYKPLQKLLAQEASEPAPEA